MYTVIICDCAFIDAADLGADSVRFDHLTEDEMQFLLRLAADRGMDVVVRRQEEEA